MKQILNPPYIAKGWIAKAFEKFSKTRINKIDGKVIRDYGIASPGNESKVVTALKFFGIIDEEGNTIPETYKIFQFSEEKKKEELKKIIHDSYNDLFEKLNIEKINNDDLRDFFIANYDYSKVRAKGAATLFIFLCEMVGISLSEGLMPKNRNINPEKKTIRKKDVEKKPLEKIEAGYAKLSFITKEYHSLNFPINSIDDWEDAKEFIEKRLQKKFNDQGPNVSKENGDSSL